MNIFLAMPTTASIVVNTQLFRRYILVFFLAAIGFFSQSLTASACEFATNGVHVGGGYVERSQATTASLNAGNSITLLSSISLGAAPHGVAVSPNSDEIWVTNFVSLGDPHERYVSIIDAQTLTVTGQIQVGRGAVNVIFSSDGNRAYVTNELDDTLSVINVASRSVIKTIALPDRPHGMSLGNAPATGESDRRLYVANLGDDSISVIDTVDFTVIKTVPVGNTPDSPAVAADGNSFWVTNYGEGEESTLSLVDSISLSEIFTLTVGVYPHGIKFDPTSNGERLYISVEGSDDVAVVDTVQRKIIARYTAGNKPHGLGVSPSGDTLWTGDLLSRTSTVLDSYSGKVLATLDTGSASNPHSIVFALDGARAYISDFTGRRLLVYTIQHNIFLPLVSR